MKIKAFLKQFCFYNGLCGHGISFICVYGYEILCYGPHVGDHAVRGFRHVHARGHPFVRHGYAGDCVHGHVHVNERVRVHGCASCLHAHADACAHGCVHVDVHACVCGRLP